MPHRIRVRPSIVTQEIKELQEAVQYLQENQDALENHFRFLVEELREMLYSEEESAPLSDEEAAELREQMVEVGRPTSPAEEDAAEDAAIREAKIEADLLRAEAAEAAEAERVSFREAEGRRAVGGEVDSDPAVQANQVIVSPNE